MATDGDARATAPKELGLDDAMAYARELQKEDRLEAADELYRRIISVAPDYPDAWHFRGMVAFQLGRLAEAETLIRRAVELAPTYSDAHNNLGNVLQHQKRAEEAVTCYERAIALQPDLADAHNNLGNALQQQKRHEEAVALYERAIALRPEMADAHFNLGKALEALDRMAEALTAYRQAVMLRPFHFDSYRRLGSALYGWGRIDDAADVYRKWLALEPDNPLARHLLSACTGLEVPARASDACVRNIFEGFADSFDQILENLQYRAPALVAEAAPTWRERPRVVSTSSMPDAAPGSAASTSSRSPGDWSASTCRSRCSSGPGCGSSTTICAGGLGPRGVGGHPGLFR